MKFEYNTTAQLFDHMSKVTKDQLVQIVFEIHKAYHFPTMYSILDLYLKSREYLLNLFQIIFASKFIEPFIFNDKINRIIKEASVEKIISKAEWHLKVRWVIHGDNYRQLYNTTSPFKLNSIVDYVNYLNQSTLEQYLLNLLNDFPELKDIPTFEKNIMNYNYLKETIYGYIYDESLNGVNENFYKRLVLRYLKHYRKETKCDEIERVLGFSMNAARSDLFNKVEKEQKMTMDEFIEIIVENNHTFIDFMNDISDENEQTLKKYAKLAEGYHRKAKSIEKSFKYLDMYIEKVLSFKMEKIRLYIEGIVEKYPELHEIQRFKDMENLASTSSTIPSIKILLNSTPHSELLRLYLILKGKSISIIDKLSDEMYYLSHSMLVDEIINVISKYPDFSKMQDIIESTLEISNNTIQQFNNYLNDFPPYILSIWLQQLIYYDYQRRNFVEMTEDPFLLSKNYLIDNIEKFLQLHHELYNPKMFSDKIDNNGKYGKVYINIINYLNVHSCNELKKYAFILQKYSRRKKTIDNIIGGIHSSLNRTSLINIIVYYIDTHKELLNMETFDTVIGMLPFHKKIHKYNNNITELRNIALHFNMYYEMKMYRIKSNDLLYANSIEDFIQSNEASIDDLKLFIFRIAKIYQELTIEGIFEDVMKYTIYSKSIDNSKLNDIINDLDENKLKSLAYKCKRYSFATLPKHQRVKDEIEDVTIDQIKVHVLKMLKDNKELLNNWGLSRIVYEQNHILYGGIYPFIYRLPLNKMRTILLYIKENYNNLTIDEDFVYKKSRDLVLEYVIDIIEEYSISERAKLIEMCKFNTMEKVTQGKISFKDIKKNKVISYGLLTEYFIRKKEKDITKENSIYYSLHDLTTEEIEDFIACNYDIYIKENGIYTLWDLEIYSQAMGFDNKEYYFGFMNITNTI